MARSYPGRPGPQSCLVRRSEVESITDGQLLRDLSDPSLPDIEYFRPYLAVSMDRFVEIVLALDPDPDSPVMKAKKKRPASAPAGRQNFVSINSKGGLEIKASFSAERRRLRADRRREHEQLVRARHKQILAEKVSSAMVRCCCCCCCCCRCCRCCQRWLHENNNVPLRYNS